MLTQAYNYSFQSFCDTIYIKTQIFRLLRYYYPAPRKIARSDSATQNITHNMTSSIKQPYGVHSHYLCFIHEKGNFNYALHKPHEQKELQGITHIFHLTENYGCHDDMVTDIHRQSQARNGVLVYRIVQNTSVTHTQQ